MASILFGSLADGGDERASSIPDLHDIRADRKSILGNPFRLGSSGDDENCRESACDAHGAYLDAVMFMSSQQEHQQPSRPQPFSSQQRPNPQW